MGGRRALRCRADHARGLLWQPQCFGDVGAQRSVWRGIRLRRSRDPPGQRSRGPRQSGIASGLQTGIDRVFQCLSISQSVGKKPFAGNGQEKYDVKSENPTHV